MLNLWDGEGLYGTSPGPGDGRGVGNLWSKSGADKELSCLSELSLW